MPNVIGHVDGLEGRSIVGWAITEPDTGCCTIEVCDENGIVLGHGQATRNRPDLASLGKGRTDFAFSVPVHLAKAKYLHVTVDGIELGASPLPAGPGYWDGILFIAEGHARGWVSQRCEPIYPIPVIEIVDQDGNVLARGNAASSPHSDRGNDVAWFDIPLPLQCYGKVELSLSASIEGRIFAHTVASLVLDGFLDILTPHHCAGWLLSPNAPATDFPIAVFLNGKLYKAITANQPRDDLRSSYPSAWRKGFDIHLEPPSSADAAVEISLRLGSTEIELFNGPFVLGDLAARVNAARKIATLAHSSDHLTTCVSAAVILTRVAA